MASWETLSTSINCLGIKTAGGKKRNFGRVSPSNGLFTQMLYTLSTFLLKRFCFRFCLLLYVASPLCSSSVCYCGRSTATGKEVSQLCEGI